MKVPGLGLSVVLNPESIFPKHLKALVAYSVYVEGHVNGRVPQGRPANTKFLTKSLAEENPELASGVPKGGKLRPWLVTWYSSRVKL